MKKFILMAGFGFGLTLGGGVIYLFATDEAFRLFAIGFGAFIMGAILIGGTAIYATRVTINSMARSHGQHPASIHYNLPEPRQQWIDSMTLYPPPGQDHMQTAGMLDAGDDYIA